VAAIKTFEGQYHRKIPVIAAGGVFTGDDIFKVFKLGASGVQMGTRFVATHECDANIRFKESYVACREEDIEIIKSPVGMPGRAIRNSFLMEIAAGKKMSFKCAWRCLKSCDIKNARYCISLALDNARQGILDKGFAFAGSNAFRVNKIVSVKELLQELINQYQYAEEKGASCLRDEYEKALEKLISLKEEYLIATKNGLSSLKDEYDRNIEKGAVLFREEYSKTVKKINLLKAEYQNAVDKANRLKAELVELFEQYALFDKLKIEGTCQEPCR
jgi:nitronate monooxygenase